VSHPEPVGRGAAVLRQLLAEQTFDLRRLDLAGFRPWLDRHLERWQRDPVFRQRVRIRDLRRANPRLRDLENLYRQLAEAEAASPNGGRLRDLERGLRDTAKAIAGLTDAVAKTPPRRQPALEQKLAGFRQRLAELEGERLALIAASPERQALDRAGADLDLLRSALQLDLEEEHLAHLLHRRGRRSGQTGDAFEATARDLTRALLLPELAHDPAAAEGLRLLTGVTLGAARTEFDQLLIRPAAAPQEPVAVLALVEAKRNLNDLAHGFRQRQENLAWLTGDATGFDPADYRTQRFRTGHFDRPAEHRQGGATFTFTRDSFAGFRRDAATGLFLDRLYLVTRTGPVWGLSSANLSRIGSRVAGDLAWAVDDAGYLTELLAWCQELAGPFETPDLLRLYAEPAGPAGRILVAG
jgi:hypothetical protein